MDTLESLLGRGGFLPHGYCFTWSPGLLWSMVGADAVIAAAYFSIPVAMLSYVRRRPDVQLSWLAWLFSGFIFACGLTHVMDIWTVWQPDYVVHAFTKVLTAAISLVTAVALWPLIPRALKIPSVQQLQSVIGELESEVGRRRTAEDQLAAIQQSLAATLASIDAGFIATDRAGKVTHMNAVAERVTGWPQREAAGVALLEVFEHEGRPDDHRGRNPVDLLLDQDIPAESSRRVMAISRPGVRTPLELRTALTRDDDGRVTGLAMVFRDLSHVVQAEAESNRLAAIVESSNDAIIGFTLDGRITSWNRAAQSIFGYGPDEAVGQTVYMLIPAELQAEEMRILIELARGNTVPAFDTVRLTRGGARLDMHITISPIKDGAGQVVGASKISRDVTRQRRAEAALLAVQRLEAENRQIQEASRLKSQFLANMSHELRTPLNAVIGFADLLHSGFIQPDSPKHREFLGHIGTSGRHLLQLINDVLDLSKVESGKLEFAPEPVDLNLLLKEVLDILQPASLRKDIHVTRDVDPTLTDLNLDPARLRQVLYNYLSNAIKFTGPGGRVVVRAMGQGPDHVRIEVEDTGIGISAADLPRLFTEFQQLDAGYDKQHAGTGLGLALTRRLVRAQGGQVGVRSTVGEGSLFYVVLNRRHGLDAVPGDEAATGGPGSVAGPLRALVIEDDQPAQARLVGGLAQAGFDVDAAGDPDSALLRARATAYSALTLDLDLPGRRGLRLLGDIRSQGASHASPVLGVTMPVEQDGHAAFAIANVLCKPVRSDEILLAMAPFKRAGDRRARVMVIDDEQASLDLMRAVLSSIDVDAVCFQDGRTALAEIDRHRPDALVLDLMMPGFDGFQVLHALQQLPAWRGLPVYIWTSMLLTDDEYAALARSARAILIKGGGTVEALLDGIRRRREAELQHGLGAA